MAICNALYFRLVSAAADSAIAKKLRCHSVGPPFRLLRPQAHGEFGICGPQYRGAAPEVRRPNQAGPRCL
ncbi:hypothetical protein ACP70R_035258 [Stipagrostis hirtigluma subsp. patula]